MDKQKILQLASRLVLAASSENEDEVRAVSEELAEVTQQPTKRHGGVEPLSQAGFNGFLKFTSQEVSKMPTYFKKYFRAEGCTIYYRKRRRGNSVSYEARYRRHGYNISVSGPSLSVIKERFVQAIKDAESGQQTMRSVPTTFNKFAVYYFENFWKRKVAQSTYVNGMYKYKNHILPYFGETRIKDITPKQCQDLIDSINAKGYGKTADETYSTLNGIFSAAIRHRLITFNPLDLVQHTQHERVHGRALTHEEESRLLTAFAGSKYQLLFAIAIYTGLRPNEYKTAKLEGKFIVAVNSKQKNGKIKYKKIPVTPMLQPYLNGITEISFPGLPYMRNKMREVLPDLILYDLRRTFNTRCVECGVADIARKLFMGHSLGKLDSAYTDVSNEYLLSEGSKINYILPPILPPNS